MSYSFVCVLVFTFYNLALNWFILILRVCVCVCVCVCMCVCVWAKSEYFISFTLVLAQKKLLKKDTYKDIKQSFQNIVKQ